VATAAYDTFPTPRAPMRAGAWILLAALALSGCRLPYVPGFTSPPPSAVAHLADANGKVVGQSVLLQKGGSVRILLDVINLPAGSHGVHIHDVGQCDPPSFDSAGAHFNPTKAAHGSANPRGPHAGDLPNIVVDATGRGHLETTASHVTLEKGSHSLFDANGSSLVIHASPDDLRTDPAGDSGARIACGVINRAG